MIRGILSFCLRLLLLSLLLLCLAALLLGGASAAGVLSSFLSVLLDALMPCVLVLAGIWFLAKTLFR